MLNLANSGQFTKVADYLPNKNSDFEIYIYIYIYIHSIVRISLKGGVFTPLINSHLLQDFK